jgi:hypothetical protein
MRILRPAGVAAFRHLQQSEQANDCHASYEKKGCLLNFWGCGGSPGNLLLALLMGSCGAAAAWQAMA